MSDYTPTLADAKDGVDVGSIFYIYCQIWSGLVNPLKGSGVRWLHFKVFDAIQV